MRKKLLIYCMILLVPAVLSGCRRTPQQRAENAIDHITETLELKDDQIAILNKIKDDFMAKRSEISKTRDELFYEALSLMESARIETGKLDSLTEKSRKHADEMIKFFFIKYAEFHDMLTPEQRAIVVEEMKRIKERRAKY